MDEGSPMEIGWMLGGLFVFIMILFMVIAVMAPELVGIGGKVAREIEASHRGEPAAPAITPSDEPPGV